MTTTALSPIGPLQAVPSGLTLHGADERRFDPIAHWSRPDPTPPSRDEANQRPLLEAPVTPIALIPEASFIPQSYVIHMASQRCLHCGTTHESSIVYAFNELFARLNLGKRVSHLVPVTKFSYNVPVKVQRLRETTVPACHECAREPMNLSHLPRPIDSAAFSRLVGPHAVSPSAKVAKGDGASSRPAPKKPQAKTIDSLFDGL